MSKSEENINKNLNIKNETEENINKYLNIKNEIDNIKIEDNPDDYQDYKDKGLNIVNFRNNLNGSYDNSHLENLDNNYIKEFNNCLDKELILKLNNFADKALYALHISNEDTDLNFFACNLQTNKYFHKLFYDKIINSIDLENKELLRPSRIYINLHKYGFPGNWHCDSPGLGPTILIYINSSWDTLWQGETAFHIDIDNTKIKYINYKCGNIVIFNPQIIHKSCDLSAEALSKCVNRYTLAYHTFYTK